MEGTRPPGRPDAVSNDRPGRQGAPYVSANCGQSGDPESPHFFDQAHLYSVRDFKPGRRRE